MTARNRTAKHAPSESSPVSLCMWNYFVQLQWLRRLPPLRQPPPELAGRID